MQQFLNILIWILLMGSCLFVFASNLYVALVLAFIVIIIQQVFMDKAINSSEYYKELFKLYHNMYFKRLRKSISKG